MNTCPRPASTLLLASIVLLFPVTSLAQKYVAPSQPQIGSANTATADPPVPRPSTTPCMVELFSNLDFADFNSKYFTYTPPSDCPRPWAKVVLAADWSVDAGRQFDRTAVIWLGGTNIYLGTTAEPSSSVARSWHTESDLTDYTPLFAAAQDGRVDLGNLVNTTYTSHLHGSAILQFYPLPSHGKANMTPTADAVFPMASDATGGTVALNSGTDQLSKTFALPTNIEQVYLDVLAQSQSSDEFWYSCSPDEVASELFGNCGSTAFRESEITIDGQPAGVAPVYPWIYTGGIDPYFWRPTPGIHTLNFEPYRVDLTPFAGVLSDGQPHQVALSVYNAHSYFSATATLLVYLDKGSSHVSGGVTKNTLAADPNLQIQENLTNTNGDIYGTVNTTAGRSFLISGFVQTSHGRVDTTVLQKIGFKNNQPWVVTPSYISQGVTQLASISSLTTTKSGWQTRTAFRSQSWPLTMNLSYTFDPSGNITQQGAVQQILTRNELQTWNGVPVYLSRLCETVQTQDTLLFNSAFQVTGNQGSKSQESYSYFDSTGNSWNRTLTSAAGVLTKISKTPAACAGY